ncbi:MAG: bifunctional diaminohydroxyphosphoribosylaminopyrimidine deaminase/5-amino-6-(5-phosphoribosylamino)uracil reductase RibD [Verrucomicrobiales bacterium]
MSVDANQDEQFMREALGEGARGIGLTSPNPAVGAVVVRNGEIVGRGWHRRAGEPHAEVEAIADARSKGGGEIADGATLGGATLGGATLGGATLYVTLEPCSTSGRTPPCVEAIREAKLARVVVGATDPNPSHAGAGLVALREAGIEVVEGVCATEARHLIRYFAKHIATGLPWVVAKTAATLDGRTTLPEGESRWISSEASREDVQRWRRQCDAILVGGETFRVDNPSLTLRGAYAEGRPQPIRVVLTSDANPPPGHRLFTDEFADRTRVHRGLTLRESLRRLGAEGVMSVMVESGGRLLSHALAEDLVDEVVLYLAPVFGGGGTRMISGDGIVGRLRDVEVSRIGPDVRICGRVAKGGN